MKTIQISHGNASHVAWIDNHTLALANGEGSQGTMRIDASDPAHPRITAATSSGINFVWAVDFHAGVLVFRASIPGTVVRVNPTSWNPLWAYENAGGHAVVSDGRRVYVPVRGTPGVLVVLDAATGAPVTAVRAPVPWRDIYSAWIDPETKHLYVGDTGRSGAVVFSLAESPPRIHSLLPQLVGDVAARENTVFGWATTSEPGRPYPTYRVEAWDISQPGAPVRKGMVPAASFTSGDVHSVLGHVVLNPAGTRLYVSFVSAGRGGDYAPDWPAGIMVFDISRGTLTHLTDVKLYMPASPFSGDPARLPISGLLAVSPDGRTLALASDRWGVFFLDISKELPTIYGDGWGLLTDGEARDVYTDGTHVYVNTWDSNSMQIFDLTTGARVGALIARPGGGGWRPFKDRLVLYRDNRLRVYRLSGGTATHVGDVTGIPGATDFVFDDPYIYIADEGGQLPVGKVGPFDPASGSFPGGLIASPRMPVNSRAICKLGHQVWVTGDYGVIAFDVTDPTNPKQIFADEFPYKFNWLVGMAAAQGRVYAGLGDAGVRVYDARGPRFVGRIDIPYRLGWSGGQKWKPTWLEVYNNRYLLVNSYWFTPPPGDGLYVYDLSVNPDAPPLVQAFPRGANWRTRAFPELGLILRVGLGGVDVIAAP